MGVELKQYEFYLVSNSSKWINISAIKSSLVSRGDGDGDGLVVSVFVFYSNNLSSNLAEDYIFCVKNVVWKEQKCTKRDQSWPIFK